ncbi:hypothetical protein GH714_002442 [Hevea brasiliensis]|uniref:Uncharacterized protein n=1 Tax=Hevea brasiliensis TaxID=3981 RepID=A0A6A6LCA0_HEVBR|nr:hypothetical protein GH714_002425 [Hevea brasiliensis]KAF2297723.1 hypothetical protein GH714_002442 [Hevea brasiliensis]
MSARRIEVNLNSSISKFLNPTQPPNLFLELRFHFNYRKLLRNLAGELIEMEAYPTAPTSSFPFQIQPLRLLDLPLCRRHLDELFSCFVFDYQLREFLTYRIANFLIFLANRHPFLGFPVVADVNIIHEDLLDANPIDLTMIMDEVSQEVIPRSASSSVLNQLRKWRNLEGDLIKMQACPFAPTSSFPSNLHHPLHLLGQPFYRCYLDDLFSCFNFDDSLREFLSCRIASFLIFIANKDPFLGFHVVVADVQIIHEDLLDVDTIDQTMIKGEVGQHAIPKSAASSALNKLNKWRFFVKEEGSDCVICLEGLSGA